MGHKPNLGVPHLVMFLLGGACGGGTVLAGDTGPGDGTAETGDGTGEAESGTEDADTADDGGPVDGVDSDGDAAGTCTTEAYWELELRTIEEVGLVDFEPSRYGMTDRLRIQVRMRSGCERLGRVEVEVANGGATDFVTVTAWAWVPRGLDCPPSAPLVPWIVVVPGRQHGNLRVVVADGGSPGGGLRLEYGREVGCSGVPECACYEGTPAGTAPEGSPCLTDCSCAEGLSCVGSFGVGGPYSACARPCNDFLDCRPDETCMEPVLDGMPWVCTGPMDQCNDRRPCPEGFECVTDTMDAPNRCEDRRVWGPTDAPCDCDQQCGANGSCIGSSDPPIAPRCAQPCLRDAECNPGSSWFCSWDNTCRFVDGFF